MKTASRAYKTQMAKLLRNHSYVGIAFGNIDISAGSDGQWMGTQTNWSEVDTLDYTHIYNGSVVTLELNRWLLNGEQFINRTNAVTGFVGSSMSDVDGNINYTMWRDFNFSHALPGITFTFDSVLNEWPVSGHLSFLQEDSTVVETDISPSSVTDAVVLVGETTRNVTLTITKMLPYRRPRVLTTLWGIGYSYSNADIVSISESNDVDPLSRRLPSEKFSFTILDYEHTFDPDNPSGIYATINRGAPIAISYGYELDDGTVEWLASDTYSLENKPVFKSSKVTFNCTGLLATMTGNYYKGTLGSKSFYDMAIDVLEDADLTPAPDGSDPWDVDASLDEMYTVAPMPIQSHASCLQMIAHACDCRLYTDENNIIHIKPFGVTPVGVFSGEFSDDGHSWISSWENVDYGTEPENTYATLEWNRWILGTNQIIANPSALILNGYSSDDVSDSSGDMSAEWTKHFDVVHDIPRIILTFDDVLEEYPYTLVVKYYSASDTLIGTATVHPTSTTFAVETEYEDCSYFTVECTATRIPYRRARIMKVSYFETDYALSLASIKQDTIVTTKLDKLRNVLVSEYSYTASSANLTKLYEATTTETELHVEFQMASDITIQVTGGTLVSSKIYAQAADLELSSGTKTVLIQGITLNEGSVVHTYEYGSSGEDDIEENHLITNKTIADAHAAHVSEYLNLRNTYDASYRGSPEIEVGDIISLETPYDNIVYGIVLVDGMGFNGALSGNIKVKGLV